MIETRLMNRFSEEILIWENGTFWGQNLCILHNSGSAGRIYLEFCPMKRANRQMRVILIIFHKKFCLGQMDHFGLINGASS